MAVRNRTHPRCTSDATVPGRQCNSVGDLPVGHLLVEAKDDGGALSGGQLAEHVEELVGVEGDHGGVPGAARLGLGPFQAPPAVPRAAGVDDAAPQVRGGVLEVLEAPVDADEHVVDEVAGHLLRQGQEEAEADQWLVVAR